MTESETDIELERTSFGVSAAAEPSAHEAEPSAEEAPSAHEAEPSPHGWPSAHEAASPREAAPETGSLPREPARTSFRQLEDVILDDSFPEVDLALRRGRHIHPGDERWYDFLLDAQGLLEPFYRRFGCALEQRNDGYFFLLPVGDRLGKRHLGVPEMIVGQGLALCFLDPRTVSAGGVITREELLNQLASVMGTDALMRALNPKRKRADERLMQRTVRQKVNEALRRLSLLGFVELLDGEQLRLWPSLMRFAEPVRGLDAPSEALKRLIERGEVSMGPGDESEDATPDADAEPDLESAEAEAEAGADASSHLARASAPSSDADSDAGSDTDSTSGAELEPGAERVSDTDTDASDIDAESDTGRFSDTDSDPGSETDSEFDRDIEPGGDGSARSPTDPDLALPPELDIDWDAPPGEKA